MREVVGAGRLRREVPCTLHPSAAAPPNQRTAAAHLLLHLPQLVCHLHPLALQLVHLWLLAEGRRRSAARGRRRCRRASCRLWPLFGGHLLLLLALVLRLVLVSARRRRAGLRRAGWLPRLLRLGPRHPVGLLARSAAAKARRRRAWTGTAPSSCCGGAWARADAVQRKEAQIRQFELC